MTGVQTCALPIFFGVDGEEMAGLVGDGCQRHSKVEIGAGESDLGTHEAAWSERR